MAEKFIALSTEDLRSMLEKAWKQTTEQGNTLLQQLRANADAASADLEIAVQSSASNGHSASAFFPGSNAPTSTEMQRGWQKLVDLFRAHRKFLLDCSKYGLDAFAIKDEGTFPSPLPAALAANLRVIVDDDDRWENLIELYALDGVDTDTVVGELVNDTAVYLWMLDNLHPVRESRGDYSDAITGRSSVAFA